MSQIPDLTITRGAFKFSVLIPVYKKECKAFFDECLRSIYKSTIRPTEIVIVEDGPLTNELYHAIEFWKSRLSILSVQLEKKSGLGPALNNGLSKCNYEIVIRADSDDVNAPDRFERILKFFERNPEVGILGSWVEEFESKICDRLFIRKCPSRSDLIKHSKTRSPFNHASVSFRKSIIDKCGGYGDQCFYEDYALWLKALHLGVIGDNIQEPLVYVRANDGLFARRGGLRYAASDVKAQYSFYNSGYINLFEFIFNVFSRVPIRMIPNKLRKYIYRKMLRS